MRAGKFDLVFCHREIATSQNDFIRIKVFEDRYIVVTRPDHSALKLGPLSAPEFLRLPLEAFLSDDYELIKRMAIESDHVARGPRFVFDVELKRGELVELMLESDFQYECWMLTTSARWRSPIIKAIARFAREKP